MGRGKNPKKNISRSDELKTKRRFLRIFFFLGVGHRPFLLYWPYKMYVVQRKTEEKKITRFKEHGSNYEAGRVVVTDVCKGRKTSYNSWPSLSVSALLRIFAMTRSHNQLVDF